MSSIDGIGIDIEEISRIQGIIDRWGTRFTERIFTASEISYCNGKVRPVQHFTARFAAKEAFGKAIGTGWAGSFRWKDVEVVNAPSGRPALRMHNALQEITEKKNVLLSLSHTERFVTAMVVIQEADTLSKQEKP